jgi:hypothetical protein
MKSGLFGGAWLIAAGVFFLSGCSGLPQRNAASSFTSPGGVTADASPLHWTPADQVKWDPVLFPGKLPTQYQTEVVGSRTTLVARANSSISMLRKPLRIEPSQLGSIRFSWLLPQLIANADMGDRASDDSPVRLVLAFEGDRSTFSLKNAMLNELALTLTGEEMPYATLMYVWCNRRPVGSVVHNHRTDRIRQLVVESGSTGLQQWRDYERNIRADYEKVFGEAPGALVGIAVMTDSDNTKSTVLAHYGDISLR